MSHLAPYLHRRKNAYSFRISVPLDLRSKVGLREFTKSLPISTYQDAASLALEYASLTKNLFKEIRKVMDLDKLAALMKHTKEKMHLLAAKDELRAELDDKDQDHRRALQISRYETEIKSLKEQMELFLAERKLLPAPIKLLSEKQHTFEQIFQVWIRLRNPAKSSMEVYQASFKKFQTKFPKLSIEAIERSHIREFVEHLQGTGISEKTIDKEIGVLRALLEIAVSEEFIDLNPASKVLLPKVSESKVRGFTIEECQKIFNSSVFTGGYRPMAGKGEAAYWIPLLLLFTGARRDEIGKLTIDRVVKSEGIDCLHLDSIDEGGRLKTTNAKRTVPVHKELLRIGFMKYVEHKRAEGASLLFDKLKPNKRGQYAAKWGDW
jgi:site-specific recombinase XerD